MYNNKDKIHTDERGGRAKIVGENPDLKS